VDEGLRKALEDFQLADTGETDEKVKAYNAKLEEETRLARAKWEAKIRELEAKVQRAKEEMERVKLAKAAAEKAEREGSAK
jgi:hypothetical protein